MAQYRAEPKCLKVLFQREKNSNTLRSAWRLACITGADVPSAPTCISPKGVFFPTCVCQMVERTASLPECVHYILPT